ncbi:MAG: AAA family ATPase [Gemmatimonadetes bacterium]|nr:AAA family ATPase [Gemmatimonadota bacterium]
MPDIPRRTNPIAEVVNRVDGQLAGATNAETVSSGFPSVDRILGGGLRRRDLIVLGGDVGVGKSSFALAVALRVAERGESAVVVSGEMDEERLWERALGIESRTRIDDIRRGKLSDEARAALGAAAVRLRDRPMLFIPTAAESFEDVAGRIHAAGAPLTVVDYLQLLPPRRAARDLAEEAAAAVRRLKEVALEADTALLVVAQLPRHNPKRRDPRPSLDDFGALGAVKYHADVVLGLYREEMYQTTRGVEGATELIVAKNRHGATGFVDLYFYRDWMRFEDMVDPDR